MWMSALERSRFATPTASSRIFGGTTWCTDHMRGRLIRQGHLIGTLKRCAESSSFLPAAASSSNIHRDKIIPIRGESVPTVRDCVPSLVLQRDRLPSSTNASSLASASPVSFRHRAMFRLGRSRALASGLNAAVKPAVPPTARLPGIAQQQTRALSIHEYLSADLLRQVSSFRASGAGAELIRSRRGR